MPPRNTYLDFLEERFSNLGQIASRYMFGGYCLYCDGTVFALVAGNALYLKADGQNRTDFDARDLKAFRPFADQDAVMQYYEAPPEIFEDEAEMKKWVGGAIEAGRRAAAKKKPKTKRPRP